MNRYDTKEALLLAYADDCLDQHERIEVDIMLKSDPDARQQLALLQASVLPFQEAFDARLDRKNPDKIIDIINNWQEPDTQLSSSSKSFKLSVIGQVAVLVIGLVIGFGFSKWSSTPNQQAANNWLHQVASYHELYVRETIASSEFNAAAKSKLDQTLKKLYGSAHSIPNLQSQQLGFKRGQMLQIEGAPLVQLAYLPTQGEPVALCITRRDGEDKDFSFGRSHNLNYVSWSRDGISYLMLGNLQSDQLKAAARNAYAQL